MSQTEFPSIKKRKKKKRRSASDECFLSKIPKLYQMGYVQKQKKYHFTIQYLRKKKIRLLLHKVVVGISFNKETHIFSGMFFFYRITITQYTERFPWIKNHNGQKKIGCFPHIKWKELMIFPSIKKDMKIS